MKHRKSPRLYGYDYTLPCGYFVTINTKDNAAPFGEIEAGDMILNAFGNIAFTSWYDIPNHHTYISVDAFVMMPNHIHGVLFLAETMTDKGASLSTVIGLYKAAVSRKMRALGFEGMVWQGRFYDHIIRSEDALHNIRVYIFDNPRRWWEKKQSG